MHQYSGSTIEEALQQATAELGRDITVVRARRVTSKRTLGFGSKVRYEVDVMVGAQAAAGAEQGGPTGEFDGVLATLIDNIERLESDRSPLGGPAGLGTGAGRGPTGGAGDAAVPSRSPFGFGDADLAEAPIGYGPRRRAAAAGATAGAGAGAADARATVPSALDLRALRGEVDDDVLASLVDRPVRPAGDATPERARLARTTAGERGDQPADRPVRPVARPEDAVPLAGDPLARAARRAAERAAQSRAFGLETRRAEPAGDAEQLLAERFAAERQHVEALAAQRLEQERAEAERVASEQAARLEAARLEAERLEVERLAAEEVARLEAARLEAERLEAERLEVERLAAEEAARLEAARLEAERLEAERLAAEEAARVEVERIEAERLEAERLEAARVEAERAAEQAERERLEAARAEQARLEAERREAAERALAERLEAERREVERLRAEQLAAERREVERAEEERLRELRRAAEERARRELERLEQEARRRAEEAERIEAERVEAERVEAERREREHLAAERLEAERLQAERIERIEREQREALELERQRLAAERERLEAERRAVEAERARRTALEALEHERKAAEAEAAEERATAERVAAERRAVDAQVAREQAAAEAYLASRRDWTASVPSAWADGPASAEETIVDAEWVDIDDPDRGAWLDGRGRPSATVIDLDAELEVTVGDAARDGADHAVIGVIGVEADEDRSAAGLLPDDDGGLGLGDGTLSGARRARRRLRELQRQLRDQAAAAGVPLDGDLPSGGSETAATDGAGSAVEHTIPKGTVRTGTQLGFERGRAATATTTATATDAVAVAVASTAVELARPYHTPEHAAPKRSAGLLATVPAPRSVRARPLDTPVVTTALEPSGEAGIDVFDDPALDLTLGGEPQWSLEHLATMGLPSVAVEALADLELASDADWMSAMELFIREHVPAPVSRPSETPGVFLSGSGPESAAAIVQAGLLGFRPGYIFVDGQLRLASSIELMLAIRSCLPR